jgi:Protein of unknown function (DUF3142)
VLGRSLARWSTLATILCATPCATLAAGDRLARIPPVVLWAWEQPQDLRGLDPARVGVASLARTLTLTGDRVSVRPRFQPLLVAPGTRIVAVGRIECDRSHRPALSPHQRSQTVAELAALARRPGVVAVQVDFDAGASQRAFYRALLADLRRALPDSTALSITALGSWCVGDRWLADLPVDEVVPMLFRMGADARLVRESFAEHGGAFGDRSCEGSVGIATDEPAPSLAHVRRVYVFHAGSWTPAALRQALDHAGEPALGVWSTAAAPSEASR